MCQLHGLIDHALPCEGGILSLHDLNTPSQHQGASTRWIFMTIWHVSPV